MKESIMSRASRILKSYRLHRAWVAAFLCLAIGVGLLTTWKLTKSGVAMTETVKVLDCKVAVHKHTDACKDAEGNLICGYSDFVIHVHDKGCYDADGNLVCKLPEIKLHEHTDACYDAEHNLICTETLTADALHTHTDACKDAEGHLICGKVELQQHVHGDGCFRTIEIEVEDPETEVAAEAAETEPGEDAEPAESGELTAEQESELEPVGIAEVDLTGEAESETAAETAEGETAEPETDENGETVTAETAEGETAEPETDENGETIIAAESAEATAAAETVEGAQSVLNFTAEVEGVKVVVEAEEGAFPEGTTMVVKPVAAESVEAAVAGAVTDRVTQIQAVDITFVDAEGKEIEPLAPIRVSITAVGMDGADEQTIMKINEDGSAEIVEQETADSGDYFIIDGTAAAETKE